MRTRVAQAALGTGLVLALLAASSAVVAEETATRPPTNLKLVGDHWTPWDPPEPGPDSYIIQKGDTLWDLAGEWLGDPFLWPQVWDENRYILDSHWIYPGDPLTIPGRPTVVPEQGPDVAELPDEEPEPEARQVVAETTPSEETTPTELVPAPLLPVAGPSDLYCSGAIETEHADSEMRVAGREMENEHMGPGEVVYLNHGRDLGVHGGDEFAIVRPVGPVQHPETEQPLGTFVRRMGKVRVMVAQERTSTAVIEMACEDILVGDELVPWVDIPTPMFEEMPEFDRYGSEPSGGATGHIVAAVAGQGIEDRFELEVIGDGTIIHTDLGVASGVQPGDVLTLFRENGDLPRLALGQAVVLTVEPSTSTAKVMLAVREMTIGDRAEVAQ